MATRERIARLARRIDVLTHAAGTSGVIDLMGWGDETEDNVIARLLPYRPELAHTPRHRIRFAFLRWMTCDQAIGRGWEAGPDGRHLASWQRAR